ncbi:MAG: hypothetical protein IIW33_03180 [Oscillospiraceae bacterium]|nr:hypothetical protein [Oscillospiraceae bacterium]
MAKSTDFRYNTGATRVPWPAVGENYNKEDLMAVVRFMMKGEGEEYEKDPGYWDHPEEIREDVIMRVEREKFGERTWRDSLKTALAAERNVSAETATLERENDGARLKTSIV